jgi:hypothetical protein
MPPSNNQTEAGPGREWGVEMILDLNKLEKFPDVISFLHSQPCCTGAVVKKDN